MNRTLVAEPVDMGTAYLLHRTSRHAAQHTYVEALGRHRARVRLGSRWVSLSPRHSELLMTLHLRTEGMTAEQLTLAIWGERAKPINARAELSRLRRVLGGRLTASPYRLRGDIRTDFDELRDLVDTAAISPKRWAATEGRCCLAPRCPSCARHASCWTTVCEARCARAAILRSSSDGSPARPVSRTTKSAATCSRSFPKAMLAGPRRSSHLRRISAEGLTR